MHYLYNSFNIYKICIHTFILQYLLLILYLNSSSTLIITGCKLVGKYVLYTLNPTGSTIAHINYGNDEYKIYTVVVDYDSYLISINFRFYVRNRRGYVLRNPLAG